MTWSIGNNTAVCTPNSSVSPCTSSMLAFLTLVTDFLGGSPDDGRHDVRRRRDTFDFLIVGAGSAGCVVANRLSEVSDWKILLLEAGDEEPLVTRIPGLQPLLMHSSIDYGYTTQPEQNVCNTDSNHSCYWASGKVMGGSSSINSMQYVRGNRYDYDSWERLGNPGWGWNDVLPYFKKSEDLRNVDILKIETDYHGTDGYLTVESSRINDSDSQVVLDAFKELGLEEIDYNTGLQLGVARLQYNTIRGARQSANHAFVHPIRSRRRNLSVRPNSVVTKVIMDEETNRAIGVEYQDMRLGIARKVYARKEVILSSGTMGSPKILMLSGIGPAEDLTKLGIRVIKNLPVGHNLQAQASTAPLSVIINGRPSTQESIQTIQSDVVQWLGNHEGPLSVTTFLDTIAFHRTSLEDHADVPDISINFIKFMDDGSANYTGSSLLPRYNGFVIENALIAPRSRGVIKLNRADPVGGKVEIYANYLSHPYDLQALIEGVRFSMRIFNTTAFKKNGFVGIKSPAKNCENLEFDTFEYYQCYAKNDGAQNHHIVGTCKMSPENDGGVVDARLRVHGIGGLRVVDASIMPKVTRGNTHAPTVMIGEKGSDLIKEDWSN